MFERVVLPVDHEDRPPGQIPGGRGVHQGGDLLDMVDGRLGAVGPGRLHAVGRFEFDLQGAQRVAGVGVDGQDRGQRRAGLAGVAEGPAIGLGRVPPIIALRPVEEGQRIGRATDRQFLSDRLTERGGEAGRGDGVMVEEPPGRLSRGPSCADPRQGRDCGGEQTGRVRLLLHELHIIARLESSIQRR